MYYLARWQGRGPEPLPGSHGVAWAVKPSEWEEGSWGFSREGKTWYCDRGKLMLLGPLEEADIRLWRLSGEPYERVTDPALCTEVMVEIGMTGEIAEWPTLLVWRDGEEIVEVWGSRFLPAFPDDPVVLLYPDFFGEGDSPEADPGEAKEWQDLEGPELPAEE